MINKFKYSPNINRHKKYKVECKKCTTVCEYAHGHISVQVDINNVLVHTFHSMIYSYKYMYMLTKGVFLSYARDVPNMF